MEFHFLSDPAIFIHEAQGGVSYWTHLNTLYCKVSCKTTAYTDSAAFPTIDPEDLVIKQRLAKVTLFCIFRIYLYLNFVNRASYRRIFLQFIPFSNLRRNYLAGNSLQVEFLPPMILAVGRIFTSLKSVGKVFAFRTIYPPERRPSCVDLFMQSCL